MLSKERMDLLAQMARGLAAQFGPGCEVVIHDLTGPDLEHTVAHVENGQVTGRAVGDGPSRAVLDCLRDGPPPEDHLAYLTRTPEGRILKSSTLYIRDGQGRAEAVFAVNYDISALLAAESALRGLTAAAQSPGREPERIPKNVGELLDDLLDQCAARAGKPPALMDREDKIRAVRFLSDAGALLITKSGDKIARFLNISKSTLYSYLEEAKSAPPSEEGASHD